LTKVALEAVPLSGAIGAEIKGEPTVGVENAEIAA
jgi:hypothetical protein